MLGAMAGYGFGGIDQRHTLATSAPGGVSSAESWALCWVFCISRHGRVFVAVFAARRQIDLFAQFPAANDAFSMTFRAHANGLEPPSATYNTQH